MNNFNKRMTQAHIIEGIDQGLRSFMLGVYNYMLIGLAVTGILAYLSVSTPALQQILFIVTPQGFFAPSSVTWILMIAQIATVFYLSMRIHALKPATAQLLFWAYAAMMGLSLAPILMTYTGPSVFRVFLITAGSFGALSLYGYTTNKDLTSMGSIMFMGLIGLILTSLVNMFLKSSGLEFIISLMGVGIFAGLIAFKTQELKSIYYEGDSADISTKKSIMGALSLYLSFINLFIYLLRLLGDRRQ